MSEWPEALVEKIVTAIEEFPNDAWGAADAALDALGLREELRGAYGYVSVRRFVTPWEEA